MGRPCFIKKSYTEVDGTNSSILKITSLEYEYETIVDTNLVEYLELFSWAKINTEDGVYFGANNTYDTHRECIKKLGLPFDQGKQLRLHRLVACLAKFDNTNGYLTVDHINRQTLDNRSRNLRWASQSEQNMNKHKVEKIRRIGARALPDDITIDSLPKYVTWNVSNEKTKFGTPFSRQFFRIESHPAHKKKWETTKSAKVSNQDKLDEALKQLEIFNGMIEPESPLREELLKEYHTIMETWETMRSTPTVVV